MAKNRSGSINGLYSLLHVPDTHKDDLNQIEQQESARSRGYLAILRDQNTSVSIPYELRKDLN